MTIQEEIDTLMIEFEHEILLLSDEAIKQANASSKNDCYARIKLRGNSIYKEHNFKCFKAVKMMGQKVMYAIELDGITTDFAEHEIEELSPTFRPGDKAIYSSPTGDKEVVISELYMYESGAIIYKHVGLNQWRESSDYKKIDEKYEYLYSLDQGIVGADRKLYGYPDPEHLKYMMRLSRPTGEAARIGVVRYAVEKGRILLASESKDSYPISFASGIWIEGLEFIASQEDFLK